MQITNCHIYQLSIALNQKIKIKHTLTPVWVDVGGVALVDLLQKKTIQRSSIPLKARSEGVPAIGLAAIFTLLILFSFLFSFNYIHLKDIFFKTFRKTAGNPEWQLEPKRTSKTELFCETT